MEASEHRISVCNHTRRVRVFNLILMRARLCDTKPYVCGLDRMQQERLSEMPRVSSARCLLSDGTCPPENRKWAASKRKKAKAKVANRDRLSSRQWPLGTVQTLNSVQHVANANDQALLFCPKTHSISIVQSSVY